MRKGIIIFALLFFFPRTVLAVNLNITKYPPIITSEPFEVEVTVEGAKPAVNYLRVDLYKPSTKNYFGETFNGSVWYEGSDGKLFFPVNIEKESTQSAVIRARVGTPSLGEFPNQGSYEMKIRRYTASGSAASSDKSTSVQIEINLPVVTSLPTPFPTSESKSDKKPSPTLTTVTLPTSSPSPIPSADIITSSVSVDKPNQVLGITDISSTSKPSATPTVMVNSDKRKLFSYVTIGGGVIFIILGIFLFLKTKNATDYKDMSEYNNKNEPI